MIMTITEQQESHQLYSESDEIECMSIEEELEKYTDKTKYNPHQESQERHKIREEYTRLIHLLQEQQCMIENNVDESIVSINGTNSDTRDSGNMMSNSLGICLEAIDRVHKNVLTTVDAALDSKVLKLTSDLCLFKGKQLYDRNKQHKLNALDLVRRLEQISSDNNLKPNTSFDWRSLSRYFMLSKIACNSIDFLLGPISIPLNKKKRTVKTSSVSSQNKQTAHLMTLEEQELMAQKNNTEATTTRVKRLNKILEDIGPISFLKFVVHPTKFSKTIENIFHCSFLVHEGRASISIQDGMTIIEACEPPIESDYKAGLSRKQFMMEMTMDTWNHALKEFAITEPIIPE